MTPRTWIALLGVAALTACYQGLDPEDWAADSFAEGTAGETTGAEGGSSGQEGDGDGDSTTSGSTTGASTTGNSTTGDGDGDPPTTGDGDGDGDPPTTGDGDGDGDPPTTGDGDGDGDPPTTGDGDGDGDPPTTGDGDGDGDPPTTGDGDGDGDGEGLPNNPYCNPVSNWSAEWVALELEVIELVNAARAQGGNCDSEGVFGPSGPVAWEPALTCAARVHSKDMADNNFFSHTNQQNNGPGWRIDQAGWNGGTWGENIAAGYGDPQAVVDGWLDSDGHCANMLNPNFSLLGVGYAFGPGQYSHYWTQNFGG